MEAVLHIATTTAVVRAARMVYSRGNTFMYSNKTEILAMVRAAIHVN